MFRLIALRFLESYFRHRWLYLLPIVMLLITAGIYFARKEPTYISRGVLSIQKESLLAKLTSIRGADYTWETPSAATMKEIYELSQTDSFIRAVVQKTDLEANMAGGKEAVEETIDEVRESLNAKSLGDSQIEIEVRHENPAVSYQLVSSVIATFVQWKINADLSDSYAATQFFSEQSAQLKVAVDAARTELYDYMEAHPLPIKGERQSIEQMEINRLETELNQAITRYSQTLDDLENSQLASAQAESDVRQSYIMIDAPQLPDKPDVSRKEIAFQLLVFLAIGVFISLMGITGAALLDRTFRFPVDISHGLDLAVLTQVPDSTPAPARRKLWKRARKPKLVEAPNEIEHDLVLISELARLDESLQEWQGIDLPLLAQVPDSSPAKSASNSKSRKKGKAREITSAGPEIDEIGFDGEADDTPGTNGYEPVELISFAVEESVDE
jgi:uncharacterized protein involved in exopolysaccharide biosynthesis